MVQYMWVCPSHDRPNAAPAFEDLVGAPVDELPCEGVSVTLPLLLGGCGAGPVGAGGIRTI